MFPALATLDVAKDIATKAINSEMAEDTEVVASWIMRMVNTILSWLGLDHSNMFASWIYVFIVFAISVAIGYLLKWLIEVIVSLIARHYKNDIFGYLYQWHFFSKICNVLPAIVFLIFIQFTLATMHSTAIVLSRATWIFITISLAMAFGKLADAIWAHINSTRNKKKLPLNGLIQLIKGVMWILVIIIDIAILVNKSPASLIAGLGAFAAVLMLIFKDSILGVVAGVQLSGNDSLHVGDWIKVKGTDANGVVTDVSLTSIKVLNWDKTTTTLPPYSLISGSFTNYRSMQQSKTREIQRSWMVDADTIVPLDDELKQKISKVPLMADYFSSDRPMDTNLGAFRAYLERYLDASSLIDQASTKFVCTLAQTGGGVPLQLYCFTSTSEWIKYEHYQSEIFEHVAVMMGSFNLATFENASGRDTILEGYLETVKSPAGLVGIPYPFFLSGNTAHDPGLPPSTEK